jgi:predicted neuraminidase
MDIRHSIITRIAGQPAIVHCSSIIQTGDWLMCVWYEGAYETSGDTVIKMSRRTLADVSWGPPEIVFDFHGLPLGNPVLWRDKGEDIYITFPVLIAESWTEGFLFYSSTGNQGVSWKEPALFLSRKGFMPKTRPLRVEGGPLLFPLYHEADLCPYVMIIEDATAPLRSTLVAETMARGKAIQPAIVQGEDEKLLMFARTNQGTIWQSVSYNDGYSWSIFEPTSLPNPDSAVDVCRRDDRVVLIYNDSATDRSCLKAAISRDGGKTWYASRVIAEGEGEYSYPSLMCTADGTFHLSFTENRYMIRHAVFDAEWVEKSPLVPPIRTR